MVGVRERAGDDESKRNEWKEMELVKGEERLEGEMELSERKCWREGWSYSMGWREGWRE